MNLRNLFLKPLPTYYHEALFDIEGCDVIAIDRIGNDKISTTSSILFLYGGKLQVVTLSCSPTEHRLMVERLSKKLASRKL